MVLGTFNVHNLFQLTCFVARRKDEKTVEYGCNSLMIENPPGDQVLVSALSL